jgi:hypothetical protein
MQARYESTSAAGKRVEFFKHLHFPPCRLGDTGGDSGNFKDPTMKMNMIRWVMTGATAALLCACAGSAASSGVQVASQTSMQYAPVPVTACRISSYPPKGKYLVIANLTTAAQIGETPTQLLNRLQMQGAELGATYVMVTSISDRKFVTPDMVDVDNNTYLNTEAQFFDTAQPTATGYNNVNGVGTPNTVQEVITAQALKITAGNNKPNKKAPSNLWQMRSN